jgi:DNA polymerase III psi subunit
MLEAMGITRWIQRPQQEATQAAPPRFIFIAESTQVDHPLLMNILKALNCAETEAQMLLVDSPASLRDKSWPSCPIIAFGESLEPYLPSQAIRTCSLIALNHDISAKKLLWKQLKSL